GTTRLWDAQTGEPLGPPLGPPPEKSVQVCSAAVSPDGRRVFADCWLGMMLMDLPSERRPFDDLVQLAGALSGERSSPDGLTSLEPASLARAWNALRRSYPADFAASPEEIAGWHERQVEEREYPPGSHEMIVHLSALIAAAPADA